MFDNTRKMMNAQQVSEYLGVSVSYAYKIIDRLNRELEKAGFLIIHGKVDSLYLSRRFFPVVEQIQIIEN